MHLRVQFGFTKGSTNINSMRRGRKIRENFILTVLIFMRIYEIHLCVTKKFFLGLKKFVAHEKCLKKYFKKGKSIKKILKHHPHTLNKLNINF